MPTQATPPLSRELTLLSEHLGCLAIPYDFEDLPLLLQAVERYRRLAGSLFVADSTRTTGP